MIQYNPRDWFGLIFKFHKSDTFIKLFWIMVTVAIYSFGVVFLIEEVLETEVTKSTTMHSLLGFVISLLLVFRTNTAYDRWWEGRKQWGTLVNVSRNLALKIKAFVPNSDHQLQGKMIDLIPTYSAVLKDHLRDIPSEQLIKALPYPLAHARAPKHVPNFVALELQELAMTAYRKHQIDQSSYLALLQDINVLTDVCGACERIKKTPIPYTYNIFIKKFIFIYILTMPLAFMGEFRYWTILVTVFTFYTLTSLELIAETIEDPFGYDADDLPTDQLAMTIKGNMDELREALREVDDVAKN